MNNTALLDEFNNRFNLAELRTLAWEMAYPYEDFPPYKTQFIAALLNYATNDGSFGVLINRVRKLRPNFNFSTPQPTNAYAEAETTVTELEQLVELFMHQPIKVESRNRVCAALTDILTSVQPIMRTYETYPVLYKRLQEITEKLETAYQCLKDS